MPRAEHVVTIESSKHAGELPFCNGLIFGSQEVEIHVNPVRCYMDQRKIPLRLSLDASENQDTKLAHWAFLLNCLMDWKQTKGLRSLPVCTTSQLENEDAIVEAIEDLCHDDPTAVFRPVCSSLEIVEAVQEVLEAFAEIDIYGARICFLCEFTDTHRFSFCLDLLKCSFKDFFLRRNGLMIFPSDGDGNCLFHSIAKVLDLENLDHREVRRRIVVQMATNRVEYEPFFNENYDTHMAKMKKNAEWGQTEHLRIAQDIWGRPFFVLRDTELCTFYGLPSDQPPCFIYHNGASHFDAIISV